MPGTEKLPRWDLSAVYGGFSDPKYAAAKRALADGAAAAEAALAKAPDASVPDAAFADWLAAFLVEGDRLGSLAQTLGSFAYASYSTDTRERAAMAELNAVEELGLPLKRAGVLWRNALAANRDRVERLAATDPRVAPYAFILREEILLASKQMSPELEDLAADLMRSGGDAWGRLQEQVSSTTTMLWDEKTGERKTTVQLRALASDADRAVRAKAYRLELEAWKGVEVPMAAALNGVKGFAVTLNKRRGWDGALEKSIEQCRITRPALDALIQAMEESLPSWRGYFKAKARALGLPAVSFYDLFAPVGSASRTYSWDEVRDTIVGRFGSFSRRMGDFAARAFAESWIDAEPREGKVGGAYCIDFPDAKAARVLCNFDGSYGELGTVAHELGHAFHAELVKDLPYSLTQYPMTLAETASIFAETVVFEDAYARATPAERLTLVESRLQDASQVIVDILSRFRFEKAVFERREKGELGPEEFSALMLEAQDSTYGDAMVGDERHPYMWAVKGHYYSPDLSFYNFPYAFGLLFATGLFARYKEEGPAFAAAYEAILADTGRMGAVELCRKAGFDIEKPDFWRKGLAVFAAQAEEFARLVDGGTR